MSSNSEKLTQALLDAEVNENIRLCTKLNKEQERLNFMWDLWLGEVCDDVVRARIDKKIEEG